MIRADFLQRQRSDEGEEEKRRGRGRIKPLEIQSLFAHDAFWSLSRSALWSQWHAQKLFASNSRRRDCFVRGCKRTALTWLGLRTVSYPGALQWDVGGRGVLSRIQSDHIDQNFVSWRQVLSAADLLQTHLLLVFFLVWSDYYYSSKLARSLQWELHKNGNNSFCKKKLVFVLR